MATCFLSGRVGRQLLICALAGSFSITGALAAPPQVLGLFVGVAEYQFAQERYPGGTLHDLAAAPRDVDSIQGALAPRVRLGKSSRLLGPQATRKEILAALGGVIASARPGDTVLFYYSGHGARLLDKSNSQFSTFSSTIVPYDAREPRMVNEGTPGDIIDAELAPLISAASAGGINVVTIIDSCNSGTITRSSPFRPAGQVRLKSAPSIKTPAAQPSVLSLPRPPRAAREGYVVHLAAVPDGAAATERLVGNVWRSDFTAALASALPTLAGNATYRDWLNAARLGLALDGTTPEPVAEGALDQPVFRDARLPTGIVEARRARPSSFEVKAGELAGIRVNSTFAAFATSGDAVANVKALGRGVIRSATPYAASFELLQRAGSTPDSIYLREEQRAPPETKLRVQVIGPANSVRSALERSLAPLNMIERVEHDPQIGMVVRKELIDLFRADGTPIVSMDGRDEERLRTNLETIARFHGLLGLKGSGAAVPIKLRISSTDCQGNQPLPFATRAGEPVLAPDISQNRFHVVLRNEGDEPVYPYIFSLGADYRVKLLYPPPGANPEPLIEGRCWNRVGRAQGQGREYFLVIAADRAIGGLSLLESGGVRGASDPLGRLLADTWAGVRSAETANLGRWTADVASYVIVRNSKRGK